MNKKEEKCVRFNYPFAQSPNDDLIKCFDEYIRFVLKNGAAHDLPETFINVRKENDGKDIPLNESEFADGHYVNMTGLMCRTVCYKGEYLPNKITFDNKLLINPDTANHHPLDFDNKSSKSTLPHIKYEYYNPATKLGCFTLNDQLGSNTLYFRIEPDAKITELFIPSAYRIIPNEFAIYNDYLKKVVWNQSKRDWYQVDSHAFYKCYNLEKIDLHKVQYIKKSAFLFCEKLNNLYLINCENIGETAFYGCFSLKKVYWSPILTKIDKRAFRLTAFEHLHFENTNLETIEFDAFGECKQLKTIKLPKSIKNIKYFAFDCCHNLEKIEIPNTTVNLGPLCFANCFKLTTIKTPFVRYSATKNNNKSPLDFDNKSSKINAIAFINNFYENHLLYEAMYASIMDNYRLKHYIAFYKLEPASDKFVDTESVRSLENSLNPYFDAYDPNHEHSVFDDYYLLPCDLYRLVDEKDGQLFIKDTTKKVRFVKVVYETNWLETKDAMQYSNHYMRKKHIPMPVFPIKINWKFNSFNHPYPSQVEIKYTPNTIAGLKVTKSIMTKNDIKIETAKILKMVEKMAQ